jgi:sugar/nucleoside kinase (ribokinase family)
VDAKTNQMFFRLDSTTKFKRVKLKAINFKEYDAIVISDYDKGFLHKDDIKAISEIHNLTFLDTKKTIGDWAEKITFVKINQYEYEKSKSIFEKDNFKNKLVKTLGPKGCEHKGKIYPVPEVEVKDLSGAGDTFLAGLVCNYLHSEDIIDSIKFANQCATEAVSQKGVVSLSKIKTFSDGKPIRLS